MRPLPLVDAVEVVARGVHAVELLPAVGHETACAAGPRAVPAELRYRTDGRHGPLASAAAGPRWLGGATTDPLPGW